MTTGIKLNCWEYTKCGREAGGHKVDVYGPCPAAVDERIDGFNGGKNAGRACWAIAGTMCGGAPKGLIALKLRDCMQCEFHRQVIKEEHKQKEESVADILDQLRYEEKKKTHTEPSLLRHAYEKALKAVADDSRVESLYISLLVGFTSFCPNISMLQASKRLCKDDLVDELWVIDSIADDKRRRATKVFVKTVFRGISHQVSGYFDPLLSK